MIHTLSATTKSTITTVCPLVVVYGGAHTTCPEIALPELLQKHTPGSAHFKRPQKSM